ncbi:hypothetical protein KKG46_04730 [Patescibacteria group bacterium]|nr:hypothetical protein [Patescibacteria group bacterium]
MSNLFTLSYWFALQPQFFTSFIGTALLVVFVAMVVVGVVGYVFSIKRKTDKYIRRAIERASGMLLTHGLFGLLLYFFAFEHIPILSMRIWFVLWLATLFIWGWFIYKYVKFEIPAKRAMKEQREKMNKWLPKSK